ncbi:DUF2125 domain-containing protein [Yoonia sp. SDW83-1]|uniref:DUF2125 domain-containing protein n=1 Tax=Yoonia sp. SDW83-1 TaxID=3366945 RepID=UPI00398C42E0
MRKLTFLVLILGALYSGYWFYGARSVEQGALQAIEQAQQDGWGVSYSALQTVGFPSRFDTSVTDLTLTAADGLWSWQAPFLQVFALSYQPNKVIAAFPPDHSLRLGDQTLQLMTEDFRASAGVKANTDLSFDAATIESGALSVMSDFGWVAAIERALIATRATDAPNTYDVYMDADGLILPADLIAQIDPKNQLADVIDRLVFDSHVTLDQPLDRHAANPLAQSFTLNRFAIDWGDVALTAAGTIDIDALGVPDGRITIKTDQWREIIDLLVNAGAIQPGVAPTITNMASTMAQEGQTLELPISFQNGFMSVGPLPIGPAPRLR